jgi:hypothetical protein
VMPIFGSNPFHILQEYHVSISPAMEQSPVSFFALAKTSLVSLFLALILCFLDF